MLVAVLAAGCGKHAPLKSGDSAPLSAESALVLPPYPQEKDLLELSAGPVGSHRYFIDAQSISVGADGIVRYSVVMRTAGGAVNTSFEGIRCVTAQKRLYAVGASGKWVPARSSEWTDIRRFNAPGEYQATLHQDYFCPDRRIVRTREDAVSALRAPPRARAE